jgi:glucose/arabinose dehydrogenase
MRQTSIPHASGKKNNVLTHSTGSNALWLFLLIAVCGVFPALASVLPAGFVESRLAAGLDPTSLEIAPDGRVFVIEKNGRIRIIKNGNLLSTPFHTLTVDKYNERGLQGIVFDPNFSSNRYVYVYYSVAGANQNRVSRFTANGDVVVPGSEVVLIQLGTLQGTVHNGGALFFSGGKLFIGTGEGSNYSLSQNMSSLLGKILRINPDGTIPTDNPFYNSAAGIYRAIWAQGMRNPFKASVQPGTGRIFINDVGGSNYEEINEGIAGRNYGWAAIEGPWKEGTNKPANYSDPFFYYNHSNGCAITGGAFYNPVTGQFPSGYMGKYFYADYCSGYIRTLDPVTKATGNFATGINRPVDLKVAPDGSLYYLARAGLGGGSDTDNTSSSNGELWRVTFSGNVAPSISAHPISRSTSVGGSATFVVGASGSAPLSYQWQRNGVNITGATASAYTVSNAQLTDNGAAFRAVVKNGSGSVTSNAATLTVLNNLVPTATITSPVAGFKYNAGQTIFFSGSGTDPEDGNVPASAYTWWVDFYHDDSGLHTHPAVAPASGSTGGSFQVPFSVHGYNVWYRVYLRVTDSKGQATTTSRDVYPNRSTYTITSNPTGLQLLLDGETIVTPRSFTTTVGAVLTVQAISPQSLNGTSYTFSGWSDGGTATHTITVPTANSTLTAAFTGTTPGPGLRTPENPANAASGLNYEYYEGIWDDLPAFSSLTPITRGTVSNFVLSNRLKPDLYGFRFTGFVDVPADGTYTFYTTSDDGSALYIGNTLVVNNGGKHPLWEKSGTIGLKAGKHALTVTYFDHAGAGDALSVSYAGPGVTKRAIAATALFRTSPTPTPFGVTLEAESAARSGVVADNLFSGYTGTGFGDYINPTNDYIEWTTNAPAAGTYTLAFRYALGNTSTRSLAIRVNGTLVQPGLTFPITSTWTDWRYVSLTTTLRAGANVIRATATGTSGPNVDHLRVTAGTGTRVANAGDTGSSENLAAGLHLFPMPVREELTVMTPHAATAQVRLTCVQGLSSKPVITRRSTNHIVLNVSGLRNGFYLLTLQTEAGQVTKGVVVQR